MIKILIIIIILKQCLSMTLRSSFKRSIPYQQFYKMQSLISENSPRKKIIEVVDTTKNSHYNLNAPHNAQVD